MELAEVNQVQMDHEPKKNYYININLIKILIYDKNLPLE